MCDSDLAALAQRVCGLTEPCIELEYLVCKALGLPVTTPVLSSFDVLLAELRARFPGDAWSFGCSPTQDGAVSAYISAYVALERREEDYRFFEAEAARTEWAFAAALLHAESYRYAEMDRLAA